MGRCEITRNRSLVLLEQGTVLLPTWTRRSRLQHSGAAIFAEYTGTRAQHLIKLPDSVSFETGSALGISFMTAGLALFKSLDLPGYPLEPSAKPLPVLVYGGSTATGTAAIQLLRLAGFAPLVTCSPHNFELVKSYGAEAVFDYRAADCAAAIRSHTRNALKYALDCITTAESMQSCYAALGRAGGRYTALDPYPEIVAATRKIVKADWVLGPIILGGDIGWPAPHGRSADKDMHQFGLKWIKTVQELLHRGLIREHPLLLQDGGLGGVLNGMEEIWAKRISGKKLVYKLERGDLTLRRFACSSSIPRDGMIQAEVRIEQGSVR